MANNQKQSRIPLIGLLLASAAAVLCNLGSTADPAGELPALNMIMTVVFIAAWICFFIFYKSASPVIYIVSLVYWAFVLAYGIACVLPALPDVTRFTGPFILVFMVLLAPMMGPVVVFGPAGTAVLVLAAAAFTGLSIYQLAVRRRAR